MNSPTAFASFVAELDLTALLPKMKEHGWTTFGEFAFCTGDPTGKDHELFKSDVIDVLLAADGSQKALIPRLRRLYAQSYIVASHEMNDYANPQGVHEKTI